MKNIIISLLLTPCLFVISCREKINCTDPDIRITFSFDSTHRIDYKMMQYERGSNFQKLAGQKELTAKNYPNKPPDETSVSAAYDWKIIVVETNKAYMIKDIGYEGERKKKTDRSFGGGESSTHCYRTTIYMLNDVVYRNEGRNYEYSYQDAAAPTINISK